jgi:hypothetical protein
MTTHEHDEEHDEKLDGAFRAVRERFDGTHPESDATLRRALLATRKNVRSRKAAMWVVLPLAAALAASTAWAGVTGRLAPAFSSVLEAVHGERPEPPPPPPPATALVSPAPLPKPVAEAVPEPEPTPEPVAAPAPPPVAPAAPIAIKSAPSVAVEPLPPASVAPAADPNAALFAEANRLHFTERDPARALAAWDRYLAAAPSGKFAREARYNRALSLIRVGRHPEAKRELEAFANGTYGDYRRAEARSLLEALARDE